MLKIYISSKMTSRIDLPAKQDGDLSESANKRPRKDDIVDIADKVSLSSIASVLQSECSFVL